MSVQPWFARRVAAGLNRVCQPCTCRVHGLARGFENACHWILREPVDPQSGLDGAKLTCDRQVAHGMTKPDRGRQIESPRGAVGGVTVAGLVPEGDSAYELLVT